MSFKRPFVPHQWGRQRTQAEVDQDRRLDAAAAASVAASTKTSWDGYAGEKHIIIDEFYGWVPRTQMQVLCDRYPAIIDLKGGARNFVAKKIWITSNDPPEQWWNRIGLGAMERRLQGEFGNVVHMTQPWAPPGEVPAPLPMVVPPVFPPPGPRAVIVPMLMQMQRHAEDEAAEAEAYRQFELAEEEEGRRIYEEWLAGFE